MKQKDFLPKNIYNGEITLNHADKVQDDLLLGIGDLNKDTKPENVGKKIKNEILLMA